MTLKAQITKANKQTNKSGAILNQKALHNFKSTQPMDWKKIFATHISNKGLVSEICKQLKLDSKKIKQSD